MKKGIKMHLDEYVKPEDSVILLSYMKGKIANDEKDKIMQALNIEGVDSNKDNQESKTTGTRKRL